MKKLMNDASKYCYDSSLGIFIIRLMTGLIFVNEGWQKFESLAKTSLFMVHLGLPMFMGPFIATLELVGGLALIGGVLTRIFGVIFGIEMIVVVFLTGLSRGLGAHSLELILAAVSFGLVFIGSGKYSLWPVECLNCGGMFCQSCPKPEKK